MVFLLRKLLDDFWRGYPVESGGLDYEMIITMFSVEW